MSGKKILLGNEAIARGAYEAGVKVSSAYPGTPPSTGDERAWSNTTRFTPSGLPMRRSPRRLPSARPSRACAPCAV